MIDSMSWPGLFSPRGKYDCDWSGELLVLSPGRTPTVDYYLAARLRRLQSASVRFVDASVEAPGAMQLGKGVFVVIVRHVSRGWLRFLRQERASLSGVAYLMDDDIPSAWLCRELPVDYRFWTTGRYMMIQGMLADVCDRIWVSTERLQSRYGRRGASRLGPMEPELPRAAAPSGTRRWGYHGTRTHEREIRWLLPVVEAVQAAAPDHEFEIFGNARIARWFAHVPRVHVLPPRPWSAYLAHCRSSNLAVGVAPLLPGRFNAVRSWVKIFDITRCGAVGVFSDREPYAPGLEGVGAALLANEQSLWSAEIVRLLANDDLRLACYDRASKWVARQGNKEDLPCLIREKAS